jgi:imidazolonepropionase-like amidohydrolase
MTAAEMSAIVETSHDLGRRVIADGHHAAGIAAAMLAGADIIDSAHLYDDSTFRLFQDRDDAYLQSHIYGVVMAVGDTEETLHDGLWGWLPDPVLRQFQQIRQRPFAMIEAYRHGIRKLSYASDAGVYTWGNNAGDFVEFVARGMSPSDAIMTATVNAAHMLGLEQDLGSIAVGKKADIVATAKSPLDDISQLMHIQFVMRDGKIFKQANQSMATTNINAEVFSP